MLSAGLAWHRNPITACTYVYVYQRIVCVSFLNKYRCTVQLAHNSGDMVFIVSIFFHVCVVGVGGWGESPALRPR